MKSFLTLVFAISFVAFFGIAGSGLKAQEQIFMTVADCLQDTGSLEECNDCLDKWTNIPTIVGCQLQPCPGDLVKCGFVIGPNLANDPK